MILHETNESFLAAVGSFLDEEKARVAVGCAADCCCVSAGEEDHDLCSEASFSWTACDVCNSGLGGDRHNAHGIYSSEKGDYIHLDICTDCLSYFANGDLPYDEN